MAYNFLLLSRLLLRFLFAIVFRAISLDFIRRIDYLETVINSIQNVTTIIFSLFFVKDVENLLCNWLQIARVLSFHYGLIFHFLVVYFKIMALRYGIYYKVFNHFISIISLFQCRINMCFYFDCRQFSSHKLFTNRKCFVIFTVAFMDRLV